MPENEHSSTKPAMPRRTLLAGAVGGALATGVTRAGATSRTRHVGAGHRTKVVLLGTAGGPPWWPRTDRAGIASAVVVGDRYYLVDAGEGVGRRLREARLGNWEHDNQGPLDELYGVFLTHLHSDHFVDLASILSVGLGNGLQTLRRVVPIWGPGNRGELPPLFGDAPPPPVVAPENPTPGARELVESLVRTYATDYNERARDNRVPVPGQLFAGHDVPIPAEYVDDPNGDPHPRMSPFVFYEDDRVRVSATLVQHAPAFPALAYRFDTDDGSVVFSGDTGPSDNLVELAGGADVLVHEVIDSRWADQIWPPPRDEVAESQWQHLVRAHTLVEDVGPIAERAGVGVLALNHLIPANWPDRGWRRARRGFSGRLVIGHDLDEIGVGVPTRPTGRTR